MPQESKYRAATNTYATVATTTADEPSSPQSKIFNSCRMRRNPNVRGHRRALLLCASGALRGSASTLSASSSPSLGGNAIGPSIRFHVRLFHDRSVSVVLLLEEVGEFVKH